MADDGHEFSTFFFRGFSGVSYDQMDGLRKPTLMLPPSHSINIPHWLLTLLLIYFPSPRLI